MCTNAYIGIDYRYKDMHTYLEFMVKIWVEIHILGFVCIWMVFKAFAVGLGYQGDKHR